MTPAKRLAMRECRGKIRNRSVAEPMPAPSMTVTDAIIAREARVVLVRRISGRR